MRMTLGAKANDGARFSAQPAKIDIFVSVDARAQSAAMLPQPPAQRNVISICDAVFG